MNDVNENLSGETVLLHRLQRMELALNGERSDDLDVGRLFRSLWIGKWFILSVTILSAIVSVAIALWLPNQYKATAVFTPASSSATSSLSRLAGQFGSLAALAGVNLGSDAGNDKTVQAIELVKSWGFLEQFIRDNNLEVDVFAADGWNRSTNQLKIDPELYDVKQKKWVRKFKPQVGQRLEPGGWELYDEFTERVSISQDKKTNLITLSVEYYSPYLAKEWVDKLAAMVNRHLQEQDRREAMTNIKYLQDKMSQTSLTEMKTVFARLIEEQTKTLMLADVSDEYVLKTLSPAKVPEEKSKPKRALICILGTLAGMLISVIILLVRGMTSSTLRPEHR